MDLMLHRGRVALGTALVSVALCGALAAQASAAPRSHGAIVHLVKPGLRANANSSNNWFGYNQGTLEQGGKQFNSIAGDWTVPTATQHAAGDESSSDWIGIGGGCVDAGCTVGDNTLIQTGTEQDVSSGSASYGAWWELIPGPSIAITNMTVQPGDHMHADISEVVAGANLWKITLQNVTRGQTFTHDRPVHLDPRDGGVDRGDAAAHRHQRRAGRAAQPDHRPVHGREGQRRRAEPAGVREDPAHRLGRQRHRDAVGPERHARRLQRLRVGDELLGDGRSWGASCPDAPRSARFIR